MVTAVRWPVRSASRALSVTAAAAKPSQAVGPVDVPAATAVSLRVSARDARGATVTETILGAYQTAS